MPLARDLNDLIRRYGGAIAKAAEGVLLPRHTPGAPLPDLTAIEACRRCDEMTSANESSA